MAKRCPIDGEMRVYLDCLECEDRGRCYSGTGIAAEKRKSEPSAIRVELLIQTPDEDSLNLESVLGVIAAALRVSDAGEWLNEAKSWLNDGLLWLDFTVKIINASVTETIASCTRILEAAAGELFRSGYQLADRSLSVVAHHL